MSCCPTFTYPWLRLCQLAGLLAIDSQVCCRTLPTLGYAPFVPHPVRRRCWRFTPTKADPCFAFLIDLVRSLRTSVRLPSGHVRLPFGLVRLPSRLVRFFLVALAADARADGPASARKGVHCKGNHDKQPGLEASTKSPQREPCAGRTLDCAKLFTCEILFVTGTRPSLLGASWSLHSGY